MLQHYNISQGERLKLVETGNVCSTHTCNHDLKVWHAQTFSGHGQVGLCGGRARSAKNKESAAGVSAGALMGLR